MTIRLTLWSAPGHLSVTSWLGPSKESTFVPEPGEKSSSFYSTRNKIVIFRGKVKFNLLLSAVKSTFTPGHPVVLGLLNFKAGGKSSSKQSEAPSPPDMRVIHVLLEGF